MENQINLALTIEEVNAVMGALGLMPYAQVAGVVEKIRAQAVPQLPKPEEAAAPQE